MSISQPPNHFNTSNDHLNWWYQKQEQQGLKTRHVLSPRYVFFWVILFLSTLLMNIFRWIMPNKREWQHGLETMCLKPQVGSFAPFIIFFTYFSPRTAAASSLDHHYLYHHRRSQWLWSSDEQRHILLPMPGHTPATMSTMFPTTTTPPPLHKGSKL